MLEIRQAAPSDWPAIWPIFQSVVADGATYAYDPDTTSDEALALWMSPAASTFVATHGGAVVGSYFLKPNQPGLGSHVANAAFMVSPAWSGHGAGRAMGEHALRTARARGYEAMQFNFVVSSNERAVSLWKSLGFATIGVIPKAYRHSRLGLVDAYIMHRFLNDILARDEAETV
ncbi:acetyltransferase [Capsulimonas corticalis]|uniref:Acetyltransferase n=1 Tax=Capsulimonas corticalis TaxID=2219043 RepID=A0A402CRK7_9BACT|nr:GNAT family N-acetyltransferase [Capsulimonas corticalis]BDI28145.1 acetyltransferase [Capsulimonas corticalis]